MENCELSSDCLMASVIAFLGTRIKKKNIYILGSIGCTTERPLPSTSWFDSVANKLAAASRCGVQSQFAV